jgi:Prokaryotic homologs of the JAB domain
MTDPGFKVENVTQTDPFRPRAAFRGYQVFGDQGDAVLVEPATAQKLRDAASGARPDETGGLVSGRTLRDGEGPYVLISGFVQAKPGSGRAVTFQISPQEADRLREESSLSNPTADVVGWWHSHSWPSSYSHTDLNTQRMWMQPNSIGLLVFANGEPWARAYLGPDAKDLGYPAAPRAHDPKALPSGTAAYPGTAHPGTAHLGTAHPGEDGQAAADAPASPPLVIPNPPSAPGSRQQGLIRLAVLIGLVLLLILILMAYLVTVVHGLPGQISSGQQHLSGQLGSVQHQVTDQAAISWSCVPVARSPNLLSCAATAWGASGTIMWKRDGQFISQTGSSVTFPVPAGRAADIQAVLKAASGATYLGTVQAVSPG